MPRTALSPRKAKTACEPNSAAITICGLLRFDIPPRFPLPPMRVFWGVRPWTTGLIAVLATSLSAGLPAAEPGEKRVSFELDVQPILTSRGCNAGACHGKARGQNGFQLSLLG